MDQKQFQQAFAQKVRALRLQRGLRQEDLEEYGVPWKTLQDVEYGKRDLRLSTLFNLADAFGLSLQELVTLPTEEV